MTAFYKRSVVGVLERNNHLMLKGTDNQILRTNNKPFSRSRSIDNCNSVEVTKYTQVDDQNVQKKSLTFTASMNLLFHRVLCCSAQKCGGRSGYPLNLSTHSLNAKTCVILGKLLTTDRMFSQISFNDCMLPEEGIVSRYYS